MSAFDNQKIVNSYSKTEEFLHSSNKFHIQLGLERMFAIMKLLGNPQEKLKVIHIAGTNGKGSVCTLIAEILQKNNYKTALYTSPHLFKYNERFKIDGENISDEDFSKYVFHTEKIATENGLNLSEFELLTATAYKYFYDKNVDFAVMETGLGGRFDAVNVVKKPVVSVITSISIDHKDRLGDTVEKIAFEKAGIIKNHVDVVINKENKGFSVIDEVAKQLNSPVFVTDKNVEIKFENNINYAVFDDKKYEFSLLGLHQKQNLELVLKVVDVLNSKNVIISDESIEKALKTAFIPARFQYDKTKNIIIDGSHNEDASIMLRNNLDFYFPDKKRIWVYGTISTKEYDKVVNILFKENDEVHLVKFDNALSVEPELIYEKIDKNYKIPFKKFSKTENTLNFFDKNSLIIITGSFYMIGALSITLLGSKNCLIG